MIMNSTITVNTLASQIRRTTDNAYQPQLKSIHIVLQRHGLKPTKKYYNGKEVEVYNTQNARRCVTQYLYEIKQEDQKIYQAQELLKHMQQNAPKYQEHQTYVPPKHWESRISKELLRMDESLGVSDEITKIGDEIFDYILKHHREYQWKLYKNATGDAAGKNDIYTKVISLSYDFHGIDISITINLFQYNPWDEYKEKYDYIAGSTKFQNCWRPGTKEIIFSFLWPITDEFTSAHKADIKGTINHELKHMFQFVKRRNNVITNQYSKALDSMKLEITDPDAVRYLIKYYVPLVYYRFDKDEVAAWLQEIYTEAQYSENIKDTETAKKIAETIKNFNWLLCVYKSKNKSDYYFKDKSFLIEQIKELIGCSPEEYFKTCKKGLDHFTKQSRKVYQRWSNETGKSVTGRQGDFKKYKAGEIEQGEIFNGKKKKGLLKFDFINNIMNTLRKIYLN